MPEEIDDNDALNDDTEIGAIDGENKADKFQRLAIARVNRAIHSIRLIGNLASRSNYDYTDEQVTKITDALINEVAQVKLKFQPKTGVPLFTL